MIVKERGEQTFSDLPFSEFLFNEDHPLQKLSAAIPWDDLVTSLELVYSKENGRPTTPLRAQVGTLMLKFLKHLPDRAAVHYVEENIYAQRFCGLSPSQAMGYMNPQNGLTNFRSRIGPDGMQLIEEVLHRVAEGKSSKKGNSLILDTTCVPLDILYPTDIRLLERCRQNILKSFQKAKQLGLDVVYRTYARTARKVFVTFAKFSRPKKKTRTKVHKQMFQFVRRNLKQLADLRQRATQELGPRSKENKTIRQFLATLKGYEQKIRLILHQQQQVRTGIRQIPGRVVSFHKDHVRPIVRGKFPLSTEFGPKILVGIVRGCTYVIATFQNNVSDAHLIVRGVSWFKERFGKFPKKVLGDRGFFSRFNVRRLEAMHILSGLQPRGKTKLSKKDAEHIRKRLPIEARISLGKRLFGWGKCLARIDSHESSWIGLGGSAMNVHCAFFVERKKKPPPLRRTLAELMT